MEYFIITLLPNAESDSLGNLFMKTCTGDSNIGKHFSSGSNDILMLWVNSSFNLKHFRNWSSVSISCLTESAGYFWKYWLIQNVKLSAICLLRDPQDSKSYKDIKYTWTWIINLLPLIALASGHE